MSSRFTEDETERYYDSEDAIYRSFWDEDGSVHWGLLRREHGERLPQGPVPTLTASWPKTGNRQLFPSIGPWLPATAPRHMAEH